MTEICGGTHKFIRNENNYLARQNEFEITRLLLSLRAISRDFYKNL